MKWSWILPNPEEEGNINQERDLLEQIIKTRKFDLKLLTQSIDDLPDEGLLANIDKACDRLRKALFNNEPLIIFGHDDPDGVTSTYILYSFLNSLGYQKHHYYIPNRYIDNHGMQKSFLDYVKHNKFSLVITVDNGISSKEAVDELNQIGCDVIITDHHLIQPDKVPNAYAIVNPQLSECNYPYKYLAGVGVVLMLIRYFSKLIEHPIDDSCYFWTAVGSYADKVPLTGINWLLIRHVLNIWDDIKDSSIAFLIRNYTRLSSTSDIANFIQYIARLIANGRETKGQHTAMRFLLQVSDEKASLFQQLEQEKNIWENNLNQVLKFIDSVLQDYEGESFIYYDDEDRIPYNLLGTTTSYVVNSLQIPAIILKKHNDLLVCEGRCSNGFNMVEAFSHCSKHLIQYGGHVRAAGFTMYPEHYNDFIDCFYEFLHKQITDEKQEMQLLIDAVCTIDDLNGVNWNKYEKLLPFGIGNPEPMLLVQGTSYHELNNKFSVDWGSFTAGNYGKFDAVITWRAPYMVKIIDLREVFSV